MYPATSICRRRYSLPPRFLPLTIWAVSPRVKSCGPSNQSRRYLRETLLLTPYWIQIDSFRPVSESEIESNRSQAWKGVLVVVRISISSRLPRC